MEVLNLLMMCEDIFFFEKNFLVKLFKIYEFIILICFEFVYFVILKRKEILFIVRVFILG